MPVFNPRLLILLVLHLCACGGGEGKKREEQKDSLGHDTLKAVDALAVSIDSDKIISDPANFDPVPELDSHFLHPSKVVLKGSFDVSKALRLLFPGKQYGITEAGDSSLMVTWSCKECKSTEIWSAGFVEDGKPIRFPGSESWDTRALDPIKATIDGKEAIILPFYSTEFNESVIHSGRFNSPVFGTAVFVRRKREWRLLDFQPAIVQIGSFGHSPQPVKLTANGAVLFTHKSSNGPAGGPFVERMLVYGWYKKQIRLLAEIYPSSRVYTGLSDWESQVSFKKEKYNALPLMVVVTRGSYHTDQLEEWEKSLLPGPIKEKALEQDKFDFILTSLYRTNGDKYILFDSKLEVLPYAPGTIQ